MESCNFCGTPVDGSATPPQNYSGEYSFTQQQYTNPPQNGYSQQQYGYGQQNPYNSYAPQAAASKPNNALGTILIILMIIIGIGAVGGIAVMLMTGYYDPSAASGSAPDVSAVIPEDYGVTDLEDINTANAVNTSGVVDLGENYYTISGGGYQPYEIRRYKTGSKDSESVYSSTEMIMSLGYYDGRLYFLQENGERGILYSINTKGKDLKTEIDDYDVHGLHIYGSNAYFYSNSYGSSGESGLVGKLDLKTGKKDVITIRDYSTILTILEYKGYLYIHYSNNTNYRAHLLVSDVQYPSVTKELSPVGGLDEDIYSMTVLGGKIYFSNIKNSSYSVRTMYSMDPDGSNVTKIADTAGSYMIGYGDYIIYTQITYGDSEDERSFEVRQIKKDGTGDGHLSTQHVMYPGIAGERIYFYDAETGLYSWTSLDGRSSGNI